MAAVEGVEVQAAAAGSRRLGVRVAGMMAGNPRHLVEDREPAGSPAEAAARSQVQEVEPPSQIDHTSVNDRSSIFYLVSTCHATDGPPDHWCQNNLSPRPSVRVNAISSSPWTLMVPHRHQAT